MKLFKRYKNQQDQKDQKSQKKLERFDFIVHPIDSFLLYIYAFIAFILLFSPGVLDFVVLYSLDGLALILTQQLSFKVFETSYPHTKNFFPYFNFEAINALDLNNKKIFINQLIQFPRIRALNIFWLSFLKILVACVVIVFYWPSHGEDYTFRLMKFWLLEIILFISFFSCSYISIHHRVSEKLKILFQYDEWRDHVFPTIEFKKSIKLFGKFDDYFTFESLSLFSLAILITLLSILYLYLHPQLTGKNIFTVAFIHLWGIILIVRHYYSYRKSFFEGLSEIFNHFQNYGKEKLRKIPYHSDQKLAKFEQAYNHLLSQLDERDRSIRRYMDYETDQAQIRILGESAGLIAHDLSGPLHTMLFCLEEIKDQRKIQDTSEDSEDLNRYYEHLESSLKRIHELVDSFKAQIRNPDQNTTTSSFGEAYIYTITVIKTQFRPQGINAKINFSFDEKLQNLGIGISRLNLVHILYNFIKNSVENLLKHNIEGASISFEYGGYDQSSHHHKIVMSDNGTGLSSKVFAELTHEDQLLEEQLGSRRGLGLRLSRRLLERFGGNIEIDTEYEKQGKGTRFNLYLGGVASAIDEQKSTNI